MANSNIIGVSDNPSWGASLGIYKLHWFQHEFIRGKTVIIGRKTWEKIDPALFKDTFRTVIVSKHRQILRDALSLTQDDREVYIMGGASMFRQTLDIVSGIRVMRFHKNAEGDIQYPPIPDVFDLSRHYHLSQSPDEGCGVSIEYYERTWPED